MKPASNQPIPATDALPETGTATVPMWLFGLLAILLYWSTLYLDEHGGGFDPQVYEPYASLKLLKDRQPRGEGDEVLIKGRKAYATYCAACHMENGVGNPTLIIPPLAGSEWVTGEGPNRMIRIVLNSLQGPITVIGKPYNNPGMPPWRDTITDDAEIAAILTFIRGNKDWGHSASPVDPKKVTEIREQTKDRRTQWTADELQAIPEKD